MDGVVLTGKNCVEGLSGIKVGSDEVGGGPEPDIPGWYVLTDSRRGSV